MASLPQTPSTPRLGPALHPRPRRTPTPAAPGDSAPGSAARRGRSSLPAWAWLLALAACSEAPQSAPPASGSPASDRPEGTRPDATPSWWEEFTSESGVDFHHTSGALGQRAFPEIMGAGVALFDGDGDGDLDLFVTNGHFPEPRGATDRYYRQTAPGRFEDATEAAGLGGTGYGMGVAVGDIDNDGDLDLFVTNVGQDLLYENRGDGRFVERSATAGVASPEWSSSALFFDYDRDGYLDLFVVRYVSAASDKPCFDRTGRPAYCGPKARPPLSDLLFHNEGDGTFRDVSESSGIAAAQAAGLGAVARDFDGDGWPDLAVANDAYVNHLWINQRDGTFEDMAFPLGIAFNQHGQAEAGMGIVSGDFDGDGVFDLLLTHLGVETNTLYRGIGSAGFQDVTGTAGIAASSMPFTGFGIVALDGDCDGDLDFLVANGRVLRSEAEETDDPWDAYAEPNQGFVNDGTGRFRETARGGPFTGPVEVSRGLATGDLDGDGDLDLALANIEGPARLYRNVCPSPGNWLQVRAVDPRLRRDAIGAVVTVEADGLRQVRVVDGQGGYLSSSTFVTHFGLGSAVAYDALRVLWPDGLEERFPGGAAGRRIELRRGTGSAD